jgi:hypothetical protein
MEVPIFFMLETRKVESGKWKMIYGARQIKAEPAARAMTAAVAAAARLEFVCCPAEGG